MGAIWRYKNEKYYHDASGANRDFIVDGSYEVYDAYSYQFSISDGTATFGSVGSATVGIYSSTTGKTTWTIANVDENPIFLRFQQ